MPKNDIPNTLSIGLYLHCGKCIEELQQDSKTRQSPADFARLAVGFTDRGIQIWCNRHECNVMHMDLQGQKHPVNASAES